MRRVVMTVALASACAGSSPTAPLLTGMEATEPVGSLTLATEAGQCLLTSVSDSGTQRRRMDITPPCGFVRKVQGGEVLVYSYPQFSAEAVYLVVGGVLSPAELAEQKKNSYIPPNEVCGNQVQGLVLSGGLVYVSPRVMHGLTCPNLGVDEKQFWQMADEVHKTRHGSGQLAPIPNLDSSHQPARTSGVP